MSVPRLVLGIIGHVDHGKTSLVRALTGTDTDRLPEEKRRGISIELGFAHFPLGTAMVDAIDMPGHERFVRTMISGATGLDAVLLVVAANEGVMPQTSEHVDIAGLLGVRAAAVAVTKADLVPARDAVSAGAAAAALLTRAGIEVAGAPVSVSSVTGTGLDALRSALGTLLAGARPQDEAGFAYLPIDRAFSVAGHGTVVTGTLRRGGLAAGDEIEAVPGGKRLRIRGLQVHGARQNAVGPGQRVAVNLRGVELSDIRRGDALATPSLLSSSAWLTVSLRAVDTAPALANGMALQMLFGTEEITARLRLLDRDQLDPGTEALAQLRLATPVAVPARERFILRQATPAVTVAGGSVLDPETTRQRRHTPAVLHRLQALAASTPSGALELLLREAGAQGVAVARAARLAGLGPAQAVQTLRALSPAPVMATRFAVASTAFAALMEKLPRALAAHPDGVGPDALHALIPAASPPVLAEAVERLMAAGKLRRTGGLVRPVDLGRDQDRAREEEGAARRLAETLRAAGLTPPDLWTLAPDKQQRRLLDRLIREGVAIRAIDKVQKRELLFHRDAVEAAQRALAPHLAGAGLLVSEVGAALGISRKFSVPLLEHLDSIRFTRRVADRRVLAQPAERG